MNEKSSKWLSNVKKLIIEKHLEEALLICEEIIKNDENNTTALLMATKCLMDLDSDPKRVKNALEKVLYLKPKHTDATKGLRKFYEKNFLLFLDDAVNFYLQLYKSNELSDKDIEIITTDLIKLNLSKNADDLVHCCLIKNMNEKSDEESLLTFCHISLEKYILFQEDTLLNKLFEFLAPITSSDPSEKLVFVQNMATFVKAVIENKDPAYIFSIKNELNIDHLYVFILLSRVLCDHYMMDDCEVVVALSLEHLQRDKTYNHEALLNVIVNIRIENYIHLGDIDELESQWLAVDSDVISKYLCCQAYAVGYKKLSEEISQWSEIIKTSSNGMIDYQRLLCGAITGGTITGDISDLHQTFTHATMTSFEWYLWAVSLETLNKPSDVSKALEFALAKPCIYFKVYLKLAELANKKKDYGAAVMHLESALANHLSIETASAFVDLHMQWGKYEEPLSLLKEIDIEFFSIELLLKFIECLSKLDRVTDAICLALMVVKKCPNESDYFQLLGDLYLRRDNINQAFKTYSRCVKLCGETVANCARLGNVWSLTYQETTDDNDFSKSRDLFDRSLELGACVQAIEGKAMVTFLHAEVSLKRLMLSQAISDINDVIKLISENADLLKDSTFHMNLLGKIIILAIMGNIDNMIDVSLIRKSYFPESVNGDCWELSLKCLTTSIEHHNLVADSHYNCGLLELYRLNKKCIGDKRGQSIDADLYSRVESHLKRALSNDTTCSEAWKYLGYLYLRHGINTEKLAVEKQHCLTMAINISATEDRINDPEAAFYLGLLYKRENWLDSAREIFKKIQMDYPVDAIGSVGMYLLAERDHTVEEQPEIARALMTYVYRDEATSVHESCYQVNSTIVTLFAENIAFLIQSKHSWANFNGNIEPTTLIEALRTALQSAWSKYLAYSAIGYVMPESDEKMYKEYGCFIGIIELLIGEYRLGQKLLKQSNSDTDNDPRLVRLGLYLNLEESWPNDGPLLVDIIRTLAKSLNVNISHEHCSSSIITSSRLFDEMLTSVIVDYLSPPHSPITTTAIVKTLIDSIASLQQVWSHEELLTSLLSLATLLLSLHDRALSSSFLDMVVQSCSHSIVTDERLVRVTSRLQLLVSSPITEVMNSLYDYCRRQPLEMDRWLNYLELGLEHCHELRDTPFFSVPALFLATARPWIMTPRHIRRYSRILADYHHCVTSEALAHHRHMFLTALKLFPDQCLPLVARFTRQ